MLALGGKAEHAEHCESPVLTNLKTFQFHKVSECDVCRLRDTPSNRAQRAMKAVQTFIYCGVAAVLLGMFNAWGFLQLYDAARSYNWPSVNGTIISSAVRSKLTRGRHGEFITHWPDVQYEYVVGDRRFVSDRIMLAHRGFSKSETQRLVDTYPVNKTIAVYFGSEEAKFGGTATRYLVAIFPNTWFRYSSDDTHVVDCIR